MTVPSVLSVIVAALFLLNAVTQLEAKSSPHSGPWRVNDVPNPMTDPVACGRLNVAQSRVCDPDNLLAKSQQDEIEGHINEIEPQQVVVVVIGQMDPKEVSWGDKVAAARSFARTLHDSWGVGSVEENDGVVVFLSVDDHAVYISTGQGVMNQLSGSNVQEIIDRMKPLLKHHDLGGALINSVIEIQFLLSGGGGLPGGDWYQLSWPVSASILAVLVWMLTVCCCCVCKDTDYWDDPRTRGSRRLDNLVRDLDTASRGDPYYSSSCPMCLEEFPSRSTDLSGVPIASAVVAPTSSPILNTPPASTGTPATAAVGVGDIEMQQSTQNATKPSPELEKLLASTSTGPRISDANSAGTKSISSSPYHWAPSAPPLPSDSSTDPMVSTSSSSSSSSSSGGGSGGTAAVSTAANEEESSGRNNNSLASALHEEEPLLSRVVGIPITRENRRPVPLPCGHVFCRGCMRAYLSATSSSSSSSSVCPICRAPIHDAGGGVGAPTSNYSNDYDTFLREERESRSSGGGYYYDTSHHRPYHGGGSRYRGGNNLLWDRDAELRYRVHRMHVLYPDVMTWQTERELNDSIDRGHLHDFRSRLGARSSEIQQYVANERAAAAAKSARSRGSSGASGRSFGGGHSSGGAGGSW